MSVDVPLVSESRQHITTPPSVLDLSLGDLEGLMIELGQPPFRAKQVFGHLHKRWVADWSACTDLPGALRWRLSQRYQVRTGDTVAEARSSDGTRKRLIRLGAGPEIEAVAIPAKSPEGAQRVSVCVSTQAGCAMACTFCATGEMGLVRNLTAGEIVDQVYAFGRDHSAARPTHVVFMGMGEPLANYNATVAAVRLLSNPAGAHISQRRITVSTSGLVPRIERLADERLDITLAISLHAPTDDLRSELMPINRRYPLSTLIPMAAQYASRSGRRVSYEYVLLSGVNDAPLHAKQLAALLPKRLSHVNLIPYNSTDAGYAASPPARARQFRDTLTTQGLSATIRASRGRDIAAACGQLKTDIDRTKPAGAGARDVAAPGDTEVSFNPIRSDGRRA